MADSKVNLLNRLVDYFLVVGLGEDAKLEVLFHEDGKAVFKPQLIDRYPVTDYEDIPFPPGVEIFCIPEGVRPKRTTIELPKFHHFAATLGNGDRLLGTCLRFLEPVPEKLIPRLEKKMAEEEEKKRQQEKNLEDDGKSEQQTRGKQPGENKNKPETESISKEQHVAALNGGPNSEHSGDEQNKITVQAPCVETKIEDVELDVAGQQEAKTTSKSDESEPVGEKAVVAPSSQGKKRTLYAMKCICIISHYDFFEQYLDFLRELYNISLSPSHVPIERYVVNFARETPLPTQGCFGIRYKIGRKDIVFSRPPPNHPIDFPPFSFTDLFKTVTTNNIITLFTALLLEYRVILVSDQYTNLTLVSELIKHLMYPFAYEHVYIPILPKTLLEILNAPMPFFVGIPRDFLDTKDVKSILFDREQMVLLDLDSNNLFATEQVPRIPPAELRKLYKMLEPLKRLFMNRKNMTALEVKKMQWKDSAISYVPSPEELDATGMSQPQINDDGVTSVQAAFLRVFVSLFKDYESYLIYPKKNADQDPNVMDDEPVFDNQKFIRKQAKDAREFLSAFLKTQAWLRFADQKVAPAPMPGEMENYDIKFFDECIIAKSNRSRFRRSRPTPFLDSKEYDIVEILSAPDPDITGLARGKIYQHHYFPKLDPKIYQATRTLEELAKDPGPLAQKLAMTQRMTPKNKRKIKGKRSLTSIPLLVKQMSHSSKLGNAKFFESNTATKNDQEPEASTN